MFREYGLPGQGFVTPPPVILQAPETLDILYHKRQLLTPDSFKARGDELGGLLGVRPFNGMYDFRWKGPGTSGR